VLESAYDCVVASTLLGSVFVMIPLTRSDLNIHNIHIQTQRLKADFFSVSDQLSIHTRILLLLIKTKAIEELGFR
jgi:hypothetical protein